MNQNVRDNHIELSMPQFQSSSSASLEATAHAEIFKRLFKVM